jgi:hypothetical protein
MTEILRTSLQAPADRLAEVRAFYAGIMGLPDTAAGGHRIGISELAFTPAEGRPFYHYAMLVPCNRFDAACEWADHRVNLLPVEHTGETVGYFEDWDAHTIYFHDPAANIVELIAHAGVGESSTSGEFSADELLQLSEIGVVGDKRALVGAICSLGAKVSDGSAEEAGKLVFIGPPTSSIIVCPADRGWLPLGRPAERYPVDLTVRGKSTAEVIACGHRIRQVD